MRIHFSKHFAISRTNPITILEMRFDKDAKESHAEETLQWRLDNDKDFVGFEPVAGFVVGPVNDEFGNFLFTKAVIKLRSDSPAIHERLVNNQDASVKVKFREDSGKGKAHKANPNEAI
jgi:hypothetical protein